MTFALSDDEVREAYILAADATNADRDNGEDFDAWLAQHDAEVRAERDAAVLANRVGPARIVQMPRSPETDRRYWEVYCPSCSTHECMFEQGDPRLTARRDEHNREHFERTLAASVVPEEPEGEHVFLESKGIMHVTFGGLGGDVGRVIITREAWRDLGESEVLAVSVLSVEQEEE